jgi:hypothetical protein
MTTKHSDPAIEQIRATRHRISQELGHDPDRLVAHYAALDNEFRDRLLSAEPEARAPAETGERLHCGEG